MVKSRSITPKEAVKTVIAVIPPVDKPVHKAANRVTVWAEKNVNRPPMEILVKTTAASVTRATVAQNAGMG